MAVSILNRLEFDVTNTNYPRPIHIAGDVYAIAYKQDTTGMVATVNITADGVITPIASAAFAAGLMVAGNVQSRFPIVHLNGDIYVIQYQEGTLDGWICTLTISAAGAISAVIDAFEYSLNTEYPDMITVGNNMVAVIGGAGPALVSIGIDNAGNIDPAITDSLAIANLTMPRIINIAGTVYAIVYRGAGTDGFVSTIDIAADGTIGGALIDSLEFDTDDCGSPFIINTSGTIYAIAYGNYSATDDGIIVTVDIDALGNIGAAIIDSFEFRANWRYDNNIVPFDGDVFSIYSTGWGTSYGEVAQVSIDAAGNITDVASGSSSVQITGCYKLSAIRISGKVHVVVCEGTDNDGYGITTGETATVTTDATSNILENTATGNGTITDLGEPAVSCTQHGHCWGLAANPTIVGDHTSLGVPGIGAFTSGLTGLIPGTLYHIRAYATNGETVTYGSDETFTTVAAPTVTTEAMTDIAPITATGNGNMTSLGVPAATQHGHCWNVTGTPTTADSKTENGAPGGIGPFTSGLTGLISGVHYYVRAYATNTVGTVYGSEVEFTAAIAIPTVQTNPATGVT